MLLNLKSYILIIHPVCILNAIFIPIFGYVAGGYTSLVSYLIVMILYFVLARKECIDNEIQMKNYFGYEGKICVVTGASSGMGKATVEMLVDLGANVYALDLNPCTINGIKEFIKCDLANKNEIDEAFKKIPEHIDSFFGVAGLSGAKTDYRTTFDCNYTANMYITLNYLKNRMSKGGSIVYCTSTAGLEWKRFKKEQNKVVHAKTWEEVEEVTRKLASSAPATFAYMYSKRCLSQFACEQAVELGKSGIRVNNVMPGSTDTGMKDEFEKMAGGKEALLAETGMAHRLATSEEMAYPIVFLNSEMSSFISGVDLCVDSADACLKTLKLKKDREAISATNKFILKMASKMMKKQAYLEGK